MALARLKKKKKQLDAELHESLHLREEEVAVKSSMKVSHVMYICKKKRVLLLEARREFGGL